VASETKNDAAPAPGPTGAGVSAPEAEPAADASGAEAAATPAAAGLAAAGTAESASEAPLAEPYVQAGLFGDSHAERLIRELEAAGLPVLGKPARLAIGPVTRVLAGPFATAAERDAAQARIQQMGLGDAVPVAR
jgi:cell division septation protein DedD